VVTADDFDWGDDVHPLTSARGKTIIYEVHVKGFTKLHPDVPEEIRGTYAGLAHSGPLSNTSSIWAWTAGRTYAGAPVRPRQPSGREGPAELLGLQHDRLSLAPHGRVQLSRRQMAVRSTNSRPWSKALHAAGLEVILDVVYNHTPPKAMIWDQLCP